MSNADGDIIKSWILEHGTWWCYKHIANTCLSYKTRHGVLFSETVMNVWAYWRGTWWCWWALTNMTACILSTWHRMLTVKPNKRIPAVLRRQDTQWWCWNTTSMAACVLSARHTMMTKSAWPLALHQHGTGYGVKSLFSLTRDVNYSMRCKVLHE